MERFDANRLANLAENARTAYTLAKDIPSEMAATQAYAACLQALELERIANSLEALVKIKENE